MALVADKTYFWQNSIKKHNDQFGEKRRKVSDQHSRHVNMFRRLQLERQSRLHLQRHLGRIEW